jgi:hypothetical protein
MPGKCPALEPHPQSVRAFGSKYCIQASLHLGIAFIEIAELVTR